MYFYTYIYMIKKTEGMVGNGHIPDCTNNVCFSHWGLPYLQKRDNKSNYRCYCFTSCRGSRANVEGTSDASKFKATLTKGHRASTSSSLWSTVHPDPSNSSSDFSSGKCEKAATNADRVPHWTLVTAMVLIRLSTSSAIVD
jgi:hypothetical protein